MRTAMLRRLIERRRVVTFWGAKYRIKPLLVDRVLGDGKQLLGFQPLNTRPAYYVIRVDSRWGKGDDDWHEHVGEIIDAIIGQFSDRERERELLIEDGVDPEKADLAYYPDELGWPVFCDDCGYSWFEMDWPKPPRRKAGKKGA